MKEQLHWAFLVDENLSHKLTLALRDTGHSAVHVADVGLLSAPDTEVWAYAQHYGLIIITQDLDFSDPVRYTPPHAGIILAANPARLKADQHIAHIIRMLAPLREPSLANLFVRIERDHVRIRPVASRVTGPGAISQPPGTEPPTP